MKHIQQRYRLAINATVDYGVVVHPGKGERDFARSAERSQRRRRRGSWPAK